MFLDGGIESLYLEGDPEMPIKLELDNVEVANIKICLILAAKGPQTDIKEMEYLLSLCKKIDTQVLQQSQPPENENQTPS